MSNPVLEAFLGPKASGVKQVLNPEQRRSPTREEKLSALKVTVKKETPEEKERRKREREEAKLQRQTLEEKEKRARQEEELLAVTQFLSAVDEQEEQTRQKRILERDGSEKPSVSESWRPDLYATGSDEARADQADASIPVNAYYARGAFPVDALVQFATRNHRLPLAHCEFAYILPSGMVWRHQHFGDSEQMRASLAKIAPNRVEMGPWHKELTSVSTKGGTSYSTLPVQRYWVLDFDMEDFPTKEDKGYVRNCHCTVTKRICSYGCWFYARLAVKVLTYLMREVFGATEVLPVFSGKRGVHLICLDECFVALGAAERVAMMKRIAAFADPATYQHPEHTTYIYEFLLKPEFYAHFLDAQKLILDERRTLHLLVLCSGVDSTRSLPPLCINLLVEITHAESREDRVDAWIRMCAQFGEDFEMRFIFRAMFPQVDERVTTGMDHLVKVIFAIHPATKRCSVPIPDIDEWLPHMAPRISEIVPPLRDDRIPDWMQERETAQRGLVLTPYVAHLQQVMNRAYPYQIRVMPAPARQIVTTRLV